VARAQLEQVHLQPPPAVASSASGAATAASRKNTRLSGLLFSAFGIDQVLPVTSGDHHQLIVWARASEMRAAQVRAKP
jgi:hypothetical protein